MQYVDLDGGLRDDRRAAPRRRALHRARAVVDDGCSTFSGTIRNISETGARLEFGGSAPLPGRFELRFENVRRWVRVVWRRQDCVGVTYDANVVSLQRR